MKKIKIGNRFVGEGEPCFVIAEAGSNHNRDFNQALKLIDVAVEARADAVKFQTYSAEKLYSRKAPKKEGEESVWDLIKRIEMPREWHKGLADYCAKKGIIFLSTPFDLQAVDELEEVDMLAYKIASFEITHLPLLEYVAKTGKPIILSTGMANLSDIETALEVINKRGNGKVILLHCVINYPPGYEDLNLRAMETMRQAFQLPVGFSDHTPGITSDVAAVALGASVIEKHFSLDRKLPGPDHPFALEPGELKAMVQAIRDTEKALGSPIKRQTNAEEEKFQLGRRGLVAACPILKGTIITRKMIEVKRPGYGIPTKLMDVVIGREAKKDIEEDEILTWEMV
ncbi:MAG: N-acetylneuraminate synthase family protein [bacterium]|nr:N-acetylneuraminate synthase family protein [bacterium]